MEKKKICQNNKTLFQLGAAALVLIIAAVLLTVNLLGGPAEITGSSVKVQYYGLSDQPPLEAYAGMIQTSLVLGQPTLKDLGRINGGEETALEVAKDIAEGVDFAPDITQLYQENSLFPVWGDDLNRVASAAEKEAADFKQETSCLKKIGGNYGGFNDINLILTSELRFQKCESDPGWHFAWMEHTFNHISEGFTCQQEGKRLFFVNDDGQVKTELEEC